ncbi:protein kinase C epsilon type-like [Sycon ciliatum]|uniref:protein kinase C epsilon type-like n=1 Tax=Sycon ciliatum TaxID=27933 RepID=UPI0031F6C747
MAVHQREETQRTDTRERADAGSPLAEGRINDFDILKKLGEGSFGKVMLAQMRETNELYAIKVIPKDGVETEEEISIEKRVLTIAGKHRFCSKLYDSFETASSVYFVMDYINGGDVLSHIESGHRFNKVEVRYYSAEIVCALIYLHNAGVVYRDLKPENVLFCGDGHIKIIDFGMCKENITNGARASSFCGTTHYMAPEILDLVEYTVSVDWWSLGVLMYEMATGDLPFDGENDPDVFRSIMHKQLRYPVWLCSDTKSVLSGFLTRPVHKRLGCTPAGAIAIKSHQFFSGINWEKLEKGEIQPPFMPHDKSKQDKRSFLADFAEEFTGDSLQDRSSFPFFSRTEFQLTGLYMQ